MNMEERVREILAESDEALSNEEIVLEITPEEHCECCGNVTNRREIGETRKEVHEAINSMWNRSELVSTPDFNWELVDR